MTAGNDSAGIAGVAWLLADTGSGVQCFWQTAVEWLACPVAMASQSWAMAIGSDGICTIVHA